MLPAQAAQHCSTQKTIGRNTAVSASATSGLEGYLSFPKGNIESKLKHDFIQEISTPR
jgi:hypothetical protein